jgi:hypothetical protein
MIIDIKLYIKGNNKPKIKSLIVDDNIIIPEEIKYYNHDDNCYSIQIKIDGIDPNSIESIIFENRDIISYIDKIIILPTGDENFEAIILNNIP